MACEAKGGRGDEAAFLANGIVGLKSREVDDRDAKIAELDRALDLQLRGALAAWAEFYNRESMIERRRPRLPAQVRHSYNARPEGRLENVAA